MELNEKFLFMAFRYALGRRTYVVSETVEEIISKWKELKPQYQNIIKREIKYAIEMGEAGHEMDVNEWKKILEL